MKLIIFKILLIYLAGTVCGQKFQQDQFPFPPQFQTPSSTFTSDNTIYLSPESHTAIPYFALNHLNKLPFQLLPPTGSKTPSMYPTPLPMYLSSTLRFGDDDEDEDDDHNEKSNNHSPVSKRLPQNQLNRTNNTAVKQALDRNDNILNSRMSNHQAVHQINQFTQPKFEVKAPSYVTIGPNERAQTNKPNPSVRRMIVTSEIQRADQGPDQAKASSYQAPQYIQAPGVFISSTTEPAIPILRLSNEMDLDGSFSYEALGADQTHYVQHSRMENMGSDKEEQVVEGSYSYIGDDGRTYTVHYVADSNGFRATGDHLPVPPPVPEIIQRAVQYNLAEEAKKPPHVRASWENDDKDYEINERTFFNNPPQRNLFTGKTPEAFSLGSNPQNNLIMAASFQTPTKSNYEMEQSKPKMNPMPTPQITFLASQGAHNPSTPAQSTKTSNSEKSPLPQLMNYEAEIKDSDQEASKALWRWQYGMNANQNPKNSISRSSAEGDDVVINFSDMTPDQYTHMIHTQVLSQNADTSNIAYNSDDYHSLYSSHNNSKTLKESEQYHSTTEIGLNTQNSEEIVKSQNIYNDVQEDLHDNKHDYNKVEINSLKKIESPDRPEIISRHSFIPQSQVATQSYSFEDTSFEPSKIIIPNVNPAVNLVTIQSNSENGYILNNIERPTTIEPINTFKTVSNVFINEENSSFKPITYNTAKENIQETTTAEAPMTDMLRENMFLRNLFKPLNIDEKVTDKPTFEYNKQQNKQNTEYHEIKQEKESKYIHNKEIPQNLIKVKSKPLDINNILNYVVLKNHFESTKTKQKNKPVQHFIQNMNEKDISPHYIPIKESKSNTYYVESNDDDTQKQNNDFRSLNRQQQQELQGLIKNYKVLQRHKTNMQRSESLSEPQRHIKAFHTQNLPPLGRAGPSMKSYLPPTYL
ncbi:uncharacterized protein LOC112048063 [Bicyclus anynana]|uniref:Uncharacterized protein LOC112048063 n=1 Tax=Bicyclus anynana TaxID=110368 RepID=A0ABM3LTC5_BICAN|nr:uncharacterized protein LOC112048063 [Bicyclus anynana]